MFRLGSALWSKINSLTDAAEKEHFFQTNL
jgi:hypothetical protein